VDPTTTASRSNGGSDSHLRLVEDGTRPASREHVAPSTPHVVIVGAGFAGLAAATALSGAPVETTVVDRHNYNTFQPLLYQVATAGLNPGDIAYPVRTYVRHHAGVRFRQGDVTGVDWEGREVRFSDGGTLAYDFLILATGATTDYFGVDGAEDHSLAVYTLEDALAVRERIFAQLERASALGASHGELTVVVVGGGPTGVEMAGTLAELRGVALATSYPDLDPSLARVVLVEQQDRLLAGFDERLSEYTRLSLTQRGVDVRLGEAVASVADDEVVLGTGEAIHCGLVLWGAGVMAGGLAQVLELGKTRGGRIEVGPDLRVPQRPEIFVVGDVAGTPYEQGLLPQLAQPAIQTGTHAGLQIRRLIAGEQPEPFRYKDKGIMATIGRRSAVAELPGGIHLRGTLAWVAWLALHIVTLIGFRNRVSVLLNWAWRYVSWKRGPKVIVGG
jgi:NADH dehydrogenase